jgi:hypothetical protein
MPEDPTNKITHLFKYTSADTSLKILASGRVRFNSPCLFNDPFDFQTEHNVHFDIKELPQLIEKEIENIVYSRKEVCLDENNIWGKALILTRMRVKKHGYYAPELKHHLNLHSIPRICQDFEHLLTQLNLHWQKLLPRIRVFCMSETKDNILMWSQYADHHKGVVLKFKILSELDTPISIAQKVIYEQTPPACFSSIQIIEHLFGIKEIDLKKLAKNYGYIKSSIWSEEKEWRVWDIARETTHNLHKFGYYKLYPQELESIYFGCKIDNENKNKIIAAAKAFNPDITFYQAEKTTTTYGLIFKKVF